MGKKTGISWTDVTWNPWQGCTKVAHGCTHCYMYREKKQYGQDPTTVIRSKPATFNLPKTLEPGQRVFVCSWSDFFHEAADPWRAEAWDIIKGRPDLTFIIPTKRVDRVRDWLPWYERVEHTCGVTHYVGAPWPTVWLLFSASTQAEFDTMASGFVPIRAAVRGVSLEPLLEPINIEAYLGQPDDEWTWEPLDWVIVAGESAGPSDRALVNRRKISTGRTLGPMFDWHPKPEAVSWVEQIRDWCQEYEVPFHFKGWGGPRPDSGGRLLDGREWDGVPKAHS